MRTYAKTSGCGALNSAEWYNTACSNSMRWLLLLQLKSGNPETRRRALHKLTFCPSAANSPALVACLHDGDASVRCKAIDAVATLRGHSAIPLLLECLLDPDPSVKKAAARGFRTIGNSDARDALANQLTNPNDTVRAAAAENLARLKDVRVIPTAIHYLEAGGTAFWVDTLANFKDERVIAALARALRNPDSSVSTKAAEALDRIGWLPRTDDDAVAFAMILKRYEQAASYGQAAVGPFLAALQELAQKAPYGGWASSEDCRLIECTAIFQDERITSALLGLADNPPYRWPALRALGKIGTQKALELIRGLLQNADAEIRRNAFEILGNVVPRPESRDFLLDLFSTALADDDFKICQGATAALQGMGPQGQAVLQRHRIDKQLGRSSLDLKALAAIESLQASKHHDAIHLIDQILALNDSCRGGDVSALARSRNETVLEYLSAEAIDNLDDDGYRWDRVREIINALVLAGAMAVPLMIRLIKETTTGEFASRALRSLIEEHSQDLSDAQLYSVRNLPDGKQVWLIPDGHGDVQGLDYKTVDCSALRETAERELMQRSRK